MRLSGLCVAQLTATAPSRAEEPLTVEPPASAPHTEELPAAVPPAAVPPAAAPPAAAQPTDPGAEEDPEGKTDKKRKQNVVIRYLDNIFGMPDEPHRPRFIVYPVVGYAPETSWEFGLSGLYVYYAKDNPKNRLSELSAFGFVTLEGQFGVHLDHAIYSNKDTWFVLGEGHFQSFPLQYYGIGPGTPAEPQAVVEETSFLIRERLLRKVLPSLYVGPEFGFDFIGNVEFNFQEGVEPELPVGAEGSLNVSAGLGVVYDSRHNVLNVRDGLFSELAFLHSNEVWGSDYTFTVLESDTRYFYPVNERDTLAAQLYGRFTFGEVPFNELSTLGGDSLLRGYYLGRYRDRNFVGTQIEYRFLPFPLPAGFLRRFGASVFAATGTVFPGDAPPSIRDFVVAGGAGLRFLLFPDKDIYTRGDLAFTAEGPAFYLFIGEAF